MEFKKLFGFLEFLKKSIKIMLKNGKLMAMVSSIYLIISSLFFVFNISTIKPMILSFITKAMVLQSLDPQGLVFPQVLITILKDVKTFVGIELAYILVLFVTSLIAQNAIISLTSVSYKDKKISPKDLILSLPKSLTRMFITSFHVTLLRVGFLCFGFSVLMVSTIVLMSEPKIVSLGILWVLVVLIMGLYLYFSVVWILSLVVSVVEECSGIEALGKAGRLVKGKKLEGLLLNFLLNLLGYVFVHFLSKRMAVKQSEFSQTFFLFILMSCICLIAVFEFQAYTVLYLECKKNHGEEIELQGNVEYRKIPQILLVDEDLP